MTEHIVPDDVQGSVLFPEYATLYDLVAREVEGLTEEQLDFSSDRWSWAEWNIRRQLSHMAFAIYMWLLVRWGDILFPSGDHGVDDVQGLTPSGFNRRLDEHRYGDVSVILHRLRGAIELAENALAQRRVGFLRHHTLLGDASDAWRLMIQAHPTYRPKRIGQTNAILRSPLRQPAAADAGCGMSRGGERRGWKRRWEPPPLCRPPQHHHGSGSRRACAPLVCG